MNLYCAAVRALALIILIKSLHCAAGESPFRPRSSQESATTEFLLLAGAEDRVPGAPPAPLPSAPLPQNEDCSDTGCLCQGYVNAPALVIPQPEIALEAWLAQAVVASWHAPQCWAMRIGWLWHLDDFPDRHLSGRMQRQWYSSLTI